MSIAIAMTSAGDIGTNSTKHRTQAVLNRDYGKFIPIITPQILRTSFHTSIIGKLAKQFPRRNETTVSIVSPSMRAGSKVRFWWATFQMH